MTTSEFIEQVICAAKRDHKARKTWQCYAGWSRRYATWLRNQPGLHATDSETKVSRYLAHLATRPGGCAPKTQHLKNRTQQPSMLLFSPIPDPLSIPSHEKAAPITARPFSFSPSLPVLSYPLATATARPSSIAPRFSQAR